MATRCKASGSKKGKALARSPLPSEALPAGIQELEDSDTTKENLEALVEEGVLPPNL